MAIVIASYSVYFAQPWWLAAAIVLAPTIWLALRRLTALGPLRRWLAVFIRCLLMLVLISLLARLMLVQKNKTLTVVAVIDRSQSISDNLQQSARDYLARALADKDPKDLFAVVDVAEAASISKLPSGDSAVRERNTSLVGDQTRLADGIQMAMAIAPPETAVRILLVSEGNETAGDVKEAARLAASNNIPIDVLPLRYTNDREVIFKQLTAPAVARNGQTISLRFILNSAAEVEGSLMLSLNGKPIDLDPESQEVTAAVQLKLGANAKTISLPVSEGGVHEFKAVFMPSNPSEDRIAQNNTATAITLVSGAGHVLVADADGSAAGVFENLLRNSEIDVQYCRLAEFPQTITHFIDCDAVVLLNAGCSSFTFQQQEMLCSYVNDLGGGLIMIGGPQSFGAGGWIGSPVADILPVDPDPPQKQQMPKGALALIMHACEMPQGNMWGKTTAIAAVNALSRLDLVGILAYDWETGEEWTYPLSPVGDKKAVINAINMMQMGDMPDFAPHIQAAYNKLKECDAVQKHIIIISDGDPQPPSTALLDQLVEAGISCSGVAVFPHSPNDVQSLHRIAQITGGRFYDVKDPNQLPQIFIKEAQVVRRSLIVENTFSPQLAFSLSEIIRGLSFPLPDLDGYILTGLRAGLAQTILVSNQSDPIFAVRQAGLGRCAAFTSSIDSRWASRWLAWGGFERFWEQVVRWTARPAQSSECEVFADVQDRTVNLTVDAVNPQGDFVQFEQIDAQIIGSEAKNAAVPLSQVGPGHYQGQYEAPTSGSYIVNIRSRKSGADERVALTRVPVTIPFAPEFRDLTDNAPLLAEISAIGGGRILGPDPENANLFDYTGTRIPETRLPLNRLLLTIATALLLVDVAVRRVTIDMRAIARKLAAVLRRRSAHPEQDQTLQRLRLTRQKLRERLSPGGVENASRRYIAKEGVSAEPLPENATHTEPKQQEPKKDAGPAKSEKEPEEQSHLQKLLKAKRRIAGQRDIDEKSDENQ